MISQVTATTFHRFMGNGRTSPAIFTCEGPDLSAPEEFVVKLRGGLERRERGLSCELYASLLASHFGILCPRPALILIETDLAEAIQEELTDEPQKARIIRESVGLNFGSQFLVNVVEWPVDKYVPYEMQAAAVKVFAFDALIQNPDRAFNNPNLVSRGDRLFIFDHELAFSFLLNIVPSVTPWKLATEDYLERHVFSKVLKGVPLPDDFLQSILSLSDEVLATFRRQLPIQWMSDDVDRIEAHLRLVKQHSEEFTEEVRRRLA